MNPLKPSATYELFVQAMVERKTLHAIYDGLARDIHPIILGCKRGEEAALVYQFGGKASSKVRDWKCLSLSKLHNVELRDGLKKDVPVSGGGNTCVDTVDLDVNPESPYSPKRNLVDLRRHWLKKQKRR